jgi:diguanylate cyclase (GGDEF)-like protein
MRKLLLATMLGVLVPVLARAQTTAELESKLSTLAGPERAKALARLTDARKLDQPEQALKYGAEALQLFRQFPDPPSQVTVLNELLWPHMAAGRYDSATFYADSGRRMAHAIGDKLGEARALSNLGTLAQRIGDPNRAVDLFTQALAIQRTVGNNDVQVANSLNNLGFVYSTDLADYSKSLNYHLEALSLREKIGDKSSIALSLNNIGIVYERLRDYEQALSYFNRALVLRRESGSKARIASTLNNIGDTYLEMGNPAKALVAQREALKLRVEVNDKSSIALSHRNIGVIYVAQGKLDAAEAELNTARRIADETTDKGLGVQVRLALAMLERNRNEPTKAATLSRDALGIAESMKSRELVRQASDELAADREAEGHLGEALQSYKRAKIVSDSIFSAETARRIASLEQQFEDERHLHELDSLRRTQAELQVQMERRAYQRDGAIGLALLIGVVGFFLYRRRVERARLAESLSVTDALTGLRNRRYLQQTIDMDVAASVRRWRSAVVKGMSVDDADLIFLMVDLDHFKAVNDAHGHAIGDQVLVQLATVLRTTCRDSDVVIRWGGEEFLILARFTDRNQAEITAERLRQAVERHVITLPNGQTIRVTCSIGYAAFPVNLAAPDATSWQDVIAMADRAAYVAKERGRNACVSAAAAERAGDLPKMPRASRQTSALQ